MSKFFETDEFVGQYSISKTLRFELIPQGRTKELLKNYMDENSRINKDFKRVDEKKNFKEIIDEYYRALEKVYPLMV